MKMKIAVVTLSLLASIALAQAQTPTNAPMRKLLPGTVAEWKQHEFSVIVPGTIISNTGDKWIQKLPKLKGWLGRFRDPKHPKPEDSWAWPQIAAIHNPHDNKVHLIDGDAQFYFVDENGVVSGRNIENGAITCFGSYMSVATNDVKAAVALFEESYDFNTIKQSYAQNIQRFAVGLNDETPRFFFSKRDSGEVSYAPPEMKYLKYQDGILDFQINGLDRSLLWDFQIDMKARKLAKSAKAPTKKTTKLGGDWKEHQFSVILPGTSITNSGEHWTEKLPKLKGWLGSFRDPKHPKPEDSWAWYHVAAIQSPYDHKIHFVYGDVPLLWVDENHVTGIMNLEYGCLNCFESYKSVATADIKAAVVIFEKNYDFNEIVKHYLESKSNFAIEYNNETPEFFFKGHNSGFVDFNPPELKLLKYDNGLLDLKINGMDRSLLWDFHIDMNARKLVKFAKSSHQPKTPVTFSSNRGNKKTPH